MRSSGSRSTVMVSGEVRPSTRLGPRPLTTWTRTTRASGREGFCSVHDPLANRVGHDQEADRHGARASLSVADSGPPRRKKGFLRPCGKLQSGYPSLTLSRVRNCPGEGISRVFPYGAGAHRHGRRRAKGLVRRIVGVEDRHFYSLGMVIPLPWVGLPLNRQVKRYRRAGIRERELCSGRPR